MSLISHAVGACDVINEMAVYTAMCLTIIITILTICYWPVPNIADMYDMTCANAKPT